MITTYLMRVAYDGRNFIGWQRQPRGRTVQAHIERALRKIYHDPHLVIHGSGRTDKGVHALGQAFHYEAEDKVPLDKLVWILNGHTDDDVFIKDVEIRKQGFHARADAVRKTYTYKIYTHAVDDPFRVHYAHFESRPLDLGAMTLATEHLLGTHDFATFQATGSSAKTSVRTLEEITIEQTADLLQLTFTADGFLYHMVRILVATLIDVGVGALSPAEIPGVLSSKDRTRARITAPAQGLYLKQVDYENP